MPETAVVPAADVAAGIIAAGGRAVVAGGQDSARAADAVAPPVAAAHELHKANCTFRKI